MFTLLCLERHGSNELDTFVLVPDKHYQAGLLLICEPYLNIECTTLNQKHSQLDG